MKYGISIYIFEDYRALLVAFYEAKNAKMQGRYSYRAFAKEAGFSSPNYVSLIIQNKRNLSESSLHDLARVMELSAREEDFFSTLVHFNQADTEAKRLFYLGRICAFREFTESHQLTQASYEYFSKYYTVAIREMTSLPEFRAEPEWIARRLKPGITVKEAERAWELLKKLELVKRDGARWKPAAAHLHTAPEVSSAVIAAYHRQMLAMAEKSLDEDAALREFAALTLAVDEATFAEVKKRIWEFMRELQRLVAEREIEPDRVLQLNMQLFHLTRLKNHKTEKGS